jgi:dipeptidyl aminopeptidase/acylaminoacyl peptidase
LTLTLREERFPDETHELSRSGSPRHRIMRAELILEWFRQHLGDGEAVTSDS